MSSTSKTMTIASGRAASFNLSRENELKVRRCWPLDSGLANRPRTKIRPFEVNLMLFPIKLVKTCMMRAESPMTFLGTSSATIGAIHFRTHSLNSFPHHSQPQEPSIALCYEKAYCSYPTRLSLYGSLYNQRSRGMDFISRLLLKEKFIV